MNNKELKISADNALEAYNNTDVNGKKLLENLFGKDIFQPQDIKERVKTFDDAVAILGNDNQAVIDYYAIADKTCTEDILAFAKLRVISEALNEGWKPTFDEDEYRYYPWFYLYEQEEIYDMDEEKKKSIWLFGGVSGSGSNCGLSCALSAAAWSPSHSVVSARLAVKSEALAIYFGQQFIDIWSDYVALPHKDDK